MGKMAQEILKEEEPDVNNLVNKIQEYETESWYNQKKELYVTLIILSPKLIAATLHFFKPNMQCKQI